MIEANNLCVCCGKVIPEGFQYCLECNEDIDQLQAIAAWSKKKNKRKHRLWDLIFGKRERKKEQCRLQ